MKTLVIRIDAPDTFIRIIVEELIKKFPVTVLDVVEEDKKYRDIPSIRREP